MHRRKQMGIQVTYKRDQLAKLPQDKITKTEDKIYRGPIYTQQDWDENPDLVLDEEKYTTVIEHIFFDGIFIGHAADGDDYLWFDNKKVNMEGRGILDKYGIEYVRS